MTKLLKAVSDRVVGSYSNRSVSAAARGRRWQELLARFPGIAEMRVLDLGGDLRSWQLGGLRPRELLIINRDEQLVHEDWAQSVVADACDLPPEIRQRSFDLVYSNSVMEHVGGHHRRRQFAEAVRTLAPSYWVQTPYRYFPVEPHWLFPGFQWLPVSARARVMRWWPLGNYPTGIPYDEAVDHVLNIELLSRAAMRAYYPDAEIWSERVLGLTKSLVAIRAA
jgi:hypothetical protein